MKKITWKSANPAPVKSTPTKPFWIALGWLWFAFSCAVAGFTYNLGQKRTYDQLKPVLDDSAQMLSNYRQIMSLSPMLDCSEKWDTHPVTIHCDMKTEAAPTIPTMGNWNRERY